MTKGDRIKFFRKQKWLTLEELATCVKLTRQTLSRYENGVIANIPSDQLAAIADVLDASPATLLGWHPTWEPDQYEDFNSAKTISEKLRLLRMWGIPKDLSAYEAELYKNADIIIASHALFDFLCLSTFYQIFPVSLVPQGFSHMVAFCPFPLFATFFCAFLKKCGQNVDKNCYSI